MVRVDDEAANRDRNKLRGRTRLRKTLEIHFVVCDSRSPSHLTTKGSKLT